MIEIKEVKDGTLHIFWAKTKHQAEALKQSLERNLYSVKLKEVL